MTESASGFIYAVVFDNSVVKIGMSSTRFGAKQRISSHGNHGRAFGHEIVYVEYIEVFGVRLSGMESEMLKACSQVAERQLRMDRGEWFKFISNELAIEFIKASVPFVKRGREMNAYEICSDSIFLKSHLDYFLEVGNRNSKKIDDDFVQLKQIPSHLIIDDTKRSGVRQSPQVAVAIKLLEMNPSMTRYEASKKAGITPSALYNSQVCRALMARRGDDDDSR